VGALAGCAERASSCATLQVGSERVCRAARGGRASSSRLFALALVLRRQLWLAECSWHRCLLLLLTVCVHLPAAPRPPASHLRPLRPVTILSSSLRSSRPRLTPTSCRASPPTGSWTSGTLPPHAPTANPAARDDGELRAPGTPSPGLASFGGAGVIGLAPAQLAGRTRRAETVRRWTSGREGESPVASLAAVPPTFLAGRSTLDPK